MPVSCTIVGCGARKSDNFKNLTFHRFPRNEIKKKKWLNIIGRENIKRNTNRALICSLHFEEKDFNKTLNVVRLRDDVLPSLLLFCMICLDTECKLYKLDKYNLHTDFKILTGIELKDEVRFVPQLCTECAQRLTNCAKFRDKSLRAYHLLAQLGERSEMLTLQQIKTINRKHNGLMSNITKRTFDPNHYDLCVIENNDHVQEIDIKTEDNETNNILNDLDDPLTVFANDFTIKTELNDGLIFENDDNIDLLDDCGTYVTEDNDILLDFDHQYLNYEIKLKKSVLNDENTLTQLSEAVKNETELNDDELPYDELPYDDGMYVFDDCDNYVNFVKSNADMDNSRSKVLRTEVNKNVVNNNKVSLSNLTLVVNRDKSNIIDGSNKNEIIFKNGSQLNRHPTVNSYKINNQIRTKKAFNNNVDNTKNLRNAVKDRTESIKSKKWNCSKNKTIKKYFANDAGLKDVRTDSIEPKNRNCSKKIKDFANYANFKDITKLIKERLERPAKQTAPLCNLKMFEVTEMSKEEQLEEIQRRKDTKKYRICQYKCTICYKGFVDSETFNIHMDKHSDKFGKLECSICRIRTMDKNTLGKHMYSNHRFRYKCLKCSFVTNQKNTALTHELWHDGKQYKCPHCGKIFQKLTTFKNHVRVKHPSDHVCHQCGFSFVGERGLSLHMSRMHRAADTEVSTLRTTNA
ncbi:zinc finger protein 33A isoform X2 [Bicyclus anynana]|uniref:Zinc finger protein 33A isoform X2 n=1 Tax=Bicyclus anynana TaxID=110368 RepID=A0ABM3M458_BICAN|nr:zinc finger protein 33A isoform X2 [Bicyclus anynana]